VSTGNDSEVIAADLAGHHLRFSTVRDEGKWKIRYISVAEETKSRAGEDIRGEWEYTGNNEVYTFSVKIESRGTEIRGWICALAEKGNRIDCMLESDGVSFTGTAEIPDRQRSTCRRVCSSGS
jgi:hypothetical protein